MIARSLLAALVATAAPALLSAQAMVQPLGLTDADLLATQMRQLAANPRDVQALATAGELSLRVGDLSGAAALFARADRVDPRNGRVKAGMASILVRSERPGEALRFFAQAESHGWPAARFAADRGLAYDLIGEGERAQRDYRLALRGGPDAETARRYALSLGITGRQAQALEQLDPLIRKQDRAAWRARAFVLAMGGDATGAARIATGMMPAGMAQGLGAFLQRLPSLTRVDRAFAVHFGEIYPTPERIADARLTPALAPLAPEPGAVAPVQVAAAVAAIPPVDRRDRRSRRERERDRRVAPAVTLARATPSTAPAPPAASARSPAIVAARSPALPSVPPSGMRETDVRVAPPVAPAVLARNDALPPARTAVPQPGATARIVPVPTSTPVGLPPVTLAREADARIAAIPAVTDMPSAAMPRAGAVVKVPRPSVRTDLGAADAVPGAVAAGTPMATSAPVVQPAAAPSPAILPVPSQPVQVAATLPAAIPSTAGPVAPVESVSATERADSVLARIVASLSIPASELGIAPLRPDPAPVPIPTTVEREPESRAGKRVVAEAEAKEARDVSLRRTVAARLAGDPQADEPTPAGRRGRGRRPAGEVVASVDADGSARAGTRGRTGTDTATDAAASRMRGRKAAVEDEPVDPRVKRVADRKALADKKAAAEKQVLADAAAADRKAARTRPARIWVQVAGGANEGDLGKAWRAAQAKAPVLAGKAGYATPLRATNRVLTGPFKTDTEARAFINQLAKQGVSGFAFTSAAGQDVRKLQTR